MKKLSFTQTLANATRDGDSMHYSIAENWLQGRTTYGGMSAALCLDCILAQYDALPPLRSAQFNFTGPASGELTASTRLLRQGKSVAFIEAELHGDKGLATHAVFCFGAARESRLNADFCAKATGPSRDQCEPFHDPKRQPIFTGEFESLLAEGDKPISGSDKNAIKLWIRHRDEQATGLTALLGVADMPPPAVLPMFDAFAPISSMTWSMNFLTQDYATEDRWWLLESIAEHARDGYSSQDMLVWNSAGKLVVTARQSVAIFY